MYRYADAGTIVFGYAMVKYVIWLLSGTWSVIQKQIKESKELWQQEQQLDTIRDIRKHQHSRIPTSKRNKCELCFKIAYSFLQDLPYAGSNEFDDQNWWQMITSRAPRVCEEVMLATTRSPSPSPPPSSGSRAANETSAKFSQSRRRPLLRPKATHLQFITSN